MDKAGKLYKFISESSDLFSDGHSAHTPQALIEEMLDKIQLEGDILVMFNIEFVISLVYNYNIDPENIIFYADSENKKVIAKKLGVKYITTLETDMKFDVVLVNPPYQDGKNKMFYRAFVSKALELSTGTTAIVCPASWNSAGLTSFKKKVLESGLKHYKYLGNNAFKGSQNDTCYFICEDGFAGDVTVQNETEKAAIPDVSVHGIIPHQNIKDASLLIKLSKFKGISGSYTRGTVNPEKKPIGPNKYVIRNGVRGEAIVETSIDTAPSIGFGSHKVVIAYNSAIGKIGPAKYITPDYSIGYAVACFMFSTVAECQNFAQYLDSKVVRFIIENLKTSIQNSKNIFEKVPKVDMTKAWTDAELYKLFDLTEEEITLVESKYK